MKRFWALILAVILSLSLAACGDSGAGDTGTPDAGNGDAASSNTPDGSEESETPDDSSVIETAQLMVGETYSTDLFDITITGFDFSKDADDPDGDYSYRPSDGYVTANLYYTVKYTGKAATYPATFEPSALFYGDGYVFNIAKFFYYRDNSGDSSNVWTDNSSAQIQPLTPEFPCKACFYVPAEVESEKGNRLFIDFLNFDPEHPIRYFPRPEDESAKETTYNYCIELFQSDMWKDVGMARSLMTELGDYKDSFDVLMESRLKYFNFTDCKFFKEYVQDMEAMSADDIQSVLIETTFFVQNNFASYVNGKGTITFHAGGTLDATYTSDGEERSMYDSWRMEDNLIICVRGTVERTFTPYQFDETRYLLIDTEGDNSMLLTQQ